MFLMTPWSPVQWVEIEAFHRIHTKIWAVAIFFSFFQFLQSINKKKLGTDDKLKAQD
jgi:hypothetical protein